MHTKAQGSVMLFYLLHFKIRWDMNLNLSIVWFGLGTLAILGRNFPFVQSRATIMGKHKKGESTEHIGKRQEERKANHIFAKGFKFILMVNCQKRMHSSWKSWWMHKKRHKMQTMHGSERIIRPIVTSSKYAKNPDGELSKEDELKLENWMMHEFRRIIVIVVRDMPREEKEKNICC